MANYLCEDSKTVDDMDTVTQHVYDMTKQARDRGFNKIYIKSKLYHVMTHTTYLGDSEATGFHFSREENRYQSGFCVNCQVVSHR